MKNRCVSTILNVKPYVPGKPIDEVKRELGLTKVYKLASNENPYPPSPKVVKAISKAAMDINRYPDGGCYELRQALAKKLKVKADQLIFGNGSDEVIVMAIRAFINKGDEVVIADPSFLVYDIASTTVGAKIKKVPLQDFRYNLDGMLKKITKRTKIVFIGNPDNPAGTFLTHKELTAFVNKVPKDVMVFVDEAYFEYVCDKSYANSLALLKKHKNIVVSRTFSKMYGLAGLRIGYGVAHKDVIDLLNRVREPFNVNSLAQEAALAILKDAPYYNKIAKEIEAQRQFLYQGLTKLNLGFQDSATNFIMIDVGQSQASKVAKALLKRGVIVRDMSVWGLTQYIRVSIGLPKENKVFLRELKSVLK